MATTFVDYTGDGNATKSFSFPSIKEADIKVDVDGVTKTSGSHYNITSYTTTGGGNVVFTSGNIPASPASIRIRRDTDVDTALATYTAGSSVKANDLNNNNKQLLYAAQEEQNQTVVTSDIKDAAITTAKIAADAVTGAKIPDNAINSEHYTDGSIDTAHLSANCVTSAKIADSAVNTTDINNSAVTTAKIADANVTTAKIADSNVTTAKIAADAVDNTKIADNSINSEHYVDASIDTIHLSPNCVTSSKIADNAVNTGDINDSAVTTAKIADSNVTTAKIADANVTTAKIAADAVDNTKIADNSINSEHYVDGSIDTIHLAANCVTSGKIADNAINTADINADAITGAKIADNAIDSEHYTDGSIDSIHLAANCVVSAKIADNAVNTTDINDSAVTTAKLADTNVTDAKLASNSVITSKITDANVTTVKIADSNVTLAKLASDLKQTTVTDDDTKLPTSGAIVDYVAAQLEPFGGFEAIATEVAFPNTQPVAGVVISIGNAGGVVVNGSGTSTTGRTVGGTTVTINNFPSSLQSKTMAADIGLMVTSTGSGQVYNYHKILAKEADVEQLSNDINDFAARYRVGSSNPTSDLDAGDLFFNTSTSKLLVYNATNSAWEEAQSIGNFYISTLSPAFDGSTQDFTITNAPSNAEQIVLSINGVIQKPNAGTSTPSEGFALSGSTVKLAAAPASGAGYFAVVIGSTVNIGTPSDGTVSTAKLASGAVTTAKIADDAITTAKIADNSIGHTKIVNGHIGTSKLADSAVTTAKIADEAVTLAKLEHGTSSNDGKFLRANNGADPSFETVTSTTINNNADNKVITGSGTANTLNAESNVVIDSSGRLLLGHSSTRPIAGNTDRTIQIEATDAKASLSITRNSANTGGPFLSLGKSRATSVGGTTIVNNGDFLGTISFAGADGTDLITRGADIIAQVDGTPGSDDMPGRLLFSTTSDGANSPTERMRLDKTGNVFIGKTVTALTSDGIRADGAGMITVSRTSTSTVGGTASGASLALCNPSATDNNFSNVGFYKADGLVTSQINGVNVSQSSRHGALSFLTHDGSVLSEKMNIDQNGDIVIGASSWSYKKALNVQGSTGAILALSNYDTTTYAADTNTSIELRVATGNTGNQNGSCEIRAFKENGTNGDNARGLGFYAAGNGSSPAERLRIHPGGEVTIPAGVTLGTAITANTAANTLDDYEEGTFSATGVNTSNSTFSSGLTGKYTKVGNRVHVSIFFFAYGGSANQTVDYFGNLPFAGVSEPHATGVIVRTSGGNNVNIEHEESCYLAQGGTQIRQKGTFSTGSSKNVTLSLTYMTTS